ncbi:MAG: hypothetical protein FWG70_10430 [Oscillospiraceae bacterium]|nr:hypothetical protein [Oscillospiraceae bacterium]
MKKSICSLVISFSFLPQVIWAAGLYRIITSDSYVLLDTGLQTAFLVVFIEITLFAVLTSFKRFYVMRVLLLGSYIQLMFTALPYEFKHSEALRDNILIFAAVGAIIAALNMSSLYIYKNIKNTKETGEQT